MKKQYIKTKSKKNIKRANTIVFFIICAVTITLGIILTRLSISELQFQPGVTDSREYSEFMLYFSIYVFQIILLILTPITAIFFGIQIGRKKGYRENASYTAVRGFTYYRDFLKDISPATMSILTDMKIENRKDISATLLKLYNKRVITFERGGIVLTGNAGNSVTLTKDETELISMIKGSDFATDRITQWKANRKQEAIDLGYIKIPDKGKDKETKVIKGCLLSGCLSVVLFVVIGLVGSVFVTSTISDADWDIFDVMAASVSSVNEVIEITVLLKKACVMMIFANLVFLIPSAMLFHTVGYAATKSKYTRTEKGEEIAEKIAGLQRFIHDFSMLSQAQKQEVFLWDDFLVYAVVLEQNENIVKEISKAYKVDISKIII